mgnify:CR=1 FL=1
MSLCQKQEEKLKFSATHGTLHSNREVHHAQLIVISEEPKLIAIRDSNRIVS